MSCWIRRRRHGDRVAEKRPSRLAWEGDTYDDKAMGVRHAPLAAAFACTRGSDRPRWRDKCFRAALLCRHVNGAMRGADDRGERCRRWRFARPASREASVLPPAAPKTHAPSWPPAMLDLWESTWKSSTGIGTSLWKMQASLKTAACSSS